MAIYDVRSAALWRVPPAAFYANRKRCDDRHVSSSLKSIPRYMQATKVSRLREVINRDNYVKSILNNIPRVPLAFETTRDLTIDASTKPIARTRRQTGWPDTSDDCVSHLVFSLKRRGQRTRHVQDKTETRNTDDNSRSSVGGILAGREGQEENRKLLTTSGPLTANIAIRKAEPETFQHPSSVSVRLQPLEIRGGYETQSITAVKFPTINGSVGKTESGSLNSNDVTSNESEKISADANMTSAEKGLTGIKTNGLKWSNQSCGTFSSNGTPNNNENGSWTLFNRTERNSGSNLAFAKPAAHCLLGEHKNKTRNVSRIENGNRNLTRDSRANLTRDRRANLTHDSRANSSSDLSGASQGQLRQLTRCRSQSNVNRQLSQHQQLPCSLRQNQNPAAGPGSRETYKHDATSTTAVARQRQNAITSNRELFGMSQSQPNIVANRSASNRNVNLSVYGVKEEDLEDEPTNHISVRIVQWLLEVQEYGEPPPFMADIEDEKPPQTDTGIHVVHKDDPDDIPANNVIIFSSKF